VLFYVGSLFSLALITFHNEAGFPLIHQAIFPIVNSTSLWKSQWWCLQFSFCLFGVFVCMCTGRVIHTEAGFSVIHQALLHYENNVAIKITRHFVWLLTQGSMDTYLATYAFDEQLSETSTTPLTFLSVSHIFTTNVIFYDTRVCLFVCLFCFVCFVFDSCFRIFRLLVLFARWCCCFVGECARVSSEKQISGLNICACMRSLWGGWGERVCVCASSETNLGWKVCVCVCIHMCICRYIYARVFVCMYVF
jgi:hypothetical protein